MSCKCSNRSYPSNWMNLLIAMSAGAEPPSSLVARLVTPKRTSVGALKALNHSRTSRCEFLPVISVTWAVCSCQNKAFAYQSSVAEKLNSFFVSFPSNRLGKKLNFYRSFNYLHNLPAMCGNPGFTRASSSSGASLVAELQKFFCCAQTGDDSGQSVFARILYSSHSAMDCWFTWVWNYKQVILFSLILLSTAETTFVFAKLTIVKIKTPSCNIFRNFAN